MYVNEILPWDGSDLGSFKSSIIKKIIEDKWTVLNLSKNKQIYKKYKISPTKNIKLITLLNSKYSEFNLLIENIKPLFGLMKRGTHTLKIDKKRYIIYYIPFDHKNNQLTNEINLSELDHDNFLRKDPQFILSVQNIFIFRELLLLCNNHEKNILIRKFEMSDHIIYHPVSQQEKNYKINEKRKQQIIPSTIYRKWFKYNDKKTVLITILKQIYQEDQISTIIFTIQEKLEQIIKNFNPKYSLYGQEIINRLSSFIC